MGSETPGRRGNERAVVVGSGPNGLVAANVLADAGLPVVVLECKAAPGGGVRSEELTLPGVRHDACAAVLPLAKWSPAVARLGLEDFGLRWLDPPLPLAHPLDDGSAVVLDRDLGRTVAGLGEDGPGYARAFGWAARHWVALGPELLAPPHLPRRPILLGKFGWFAARSATSLVKLLRLGPRGAALVGGLAGHSFLPLEQAPSAAFALVLGSLAHSVGWPIVAGGSGRLTDALVERLRSRGGELRTGCEGGQFDAIRPASPVLLDLTPRQVLAALGDALPAEYAGALRRYRYGPGAFKVDWALDTPIPWRAPLCRQAATVHVGGSFEEIAAGEAAVARGEHPERPLLILTQPSLFDPTRAPAGVHVAGAYCHVPNGSNRDMSAVIEAQVERFAPGFSRRILARHCRSASDMEAYNPNCVGGDINGGLADWRQLIARPVARLNPYATPLNRVFLCSSSTPPGGGVHGLCGQYAAEAALRHERRGRGQGR